ncbi:MAG: lysylphosphatidylglycerol synthase transmembrane domain-containing protein [Bacteroidales bacterium]|nr:lysylphosphatidylglycerol synthase transmembrane domain-containing protein [Bacteroidales bacterium]
MNKKLKNIIKVIAFTSVGLFLFWLVYRDFDFADLFGRMSQLNYEWFILMAAIGVLSHISRSMRWQMLLESNGEKPRFINTFLAVLNGYFANIAIPRLGEVTRCAVVSKYEKIPFPKVLGTMVSERLVDVLVLILFTILAFIVGSSQLKTFAENNPELGKNLEFLLSWPILLGFLLFAIIGIVILVMIARGKFNKYKLFAKISSFINSFWEGIISLKKVKKPFVFILHSLFIWAMYFLMLYVCFFAFDSMKDLSLSAALILFVAGSFGMVAPAPNGIGAYHFMIIQTLLIYGISKQDAAGFALIVHGLQTVLLIILGVLSFVLIPIVNKTK